MSSKRFELDDVGDMKIIVINFEALDVSMSVREMWCITTKSLKC